MPIHQSSSMEVGERKEGRDWWIVDNRGSINRFKWEVVEVVVESSSLDECVGACDTAWRWRREKKRITLKWRERAIITLTQMNWNVRQHHVSSVTACQSNQWVAMMSTPTIIHCLNTSILGTTYGNCQCRATFVPFQVCVDYHPIKVPKRQFRCWRPGPFSYPTSCR